MKKSQIAVVFFLILLLPAISYPQNSQRPKIGLALSGGGAKGMAHIGVLKVLEEAGIVPDYVTGTSMGSIIGGLYAIGYSPEELEQITQEADWDRLLSNQISLKEVAYEEKKYYGRYVLDLPIRNLRPGLPSGLIEGQNLSAYLSTLTRSVHGVEHFDDFPIPFRCVATDIASGDIVVLDHGSLSEAMRASMAIPSIFTTESIDGKLLVDGGLVRNFPVQEVIDMGADIVIGVFVSSDLSQPEELKSLVDILGQSAFIMSALDTREQTKLCDLYIEPDLTGYGTYSFGSGKEIIERGVEMGDSLKPRILKIANKIKAAGVKLEKAKKLPERSKYPIAHITVVGNKEIPSDLIKAKLRVRENDTVDTGVISKRIREVYGTGYFQKIAYDLIPEGDDQYNLKIKVRESERARLKIALHYNNEIRAGINANLTLRNILLKSSRALLEIDFAENPRIDLNYLKYLGRKQNAASQLGADVELYEVPLFSDGNRISTLNNNLLSPYITLFTTVQSTRSFGIIAGADFSYLTPKVSDFLSFIERVNFETYYAGAFMGFNTLDKPFFPTRGANLSLSYKYIFENNSSVIFNPDDSVEQAAGEALFQVGDYQSFKLDYSGYFPIGRILNANFFLSSLYSSARNIGINNEIGLGGFYQNYERTQMFWGGELFEYISPYYGMAGMALRARFISNLYLTGRVNYLSSKYPAQWVDPSAEDVDFNSKTEVLGWGFELAYMSPFGPLSVNIGSTDQAKSWRTGINIGFWIY